MDGRVARRQWVPYALLAPGLAWLALFFVVPLFSLGRKSLERGGLHNYSKVLSDNAAVIGRTFLYALAATMGALVLGYPLAYVIATRGGRAKNLLLALVVLPFFTTYLIRTIAWKVLLFGDGPVVRFLRFTHVFGRNSELLGTHWAVIGALTYNFLPFMVLPIYVSLEKIDPRLLEAGVDLYATPTATFRRVTLPLSMPGMFAGSLLTFIPAAGDFVNAELLGSDSQRMIGNIIAKNFEKEVFRPEISALSFGLMVVILSGVLLYARLLGTEDLI